MRCWICRANAAESTEAFGKRVWWCARCWRERLESIARERKVRYGRRRR